MTNKPNDVRVSHELMPCPFCGCAVRMEDQVPLFRVMGDHTGTCPLSLEEPLVGLPEQWNTRAQPADQQGGPVAYIRSKYGDPEAFGEREIEMVVDLSKVPYDTPLYRHARPATAKVDEDEEFEKAYQSVVDNGWTSAKQMARQVWQARAKLNTPQ